MKLFVRRILVPLLLSTYAASSFGGEFGTPTPTAPVAPTDRIERFRLQLHNGQYMYGSRGSFDHAIFRGKGSDKQTMMIPIADIASLEVRRSQELRGLATGAACSLIIILFGSSDEFYGHNEMADIYRAHLLWIMPLLGYTIGSALSVWVPVDLAAVTAANARPQEAMVVLRLNF